MKKLFSVLSVSLALSSISLASDSQNYNWGNSTRGEYCYLADQYGIPLYGREPVSDSFCGPLFYNWFRATDGVSRCYIVKSDGYPLSRREAVSDSNCKSEKKPSAEIVKPQEQQKSLSDNKQSCDFDEIKNNCATKSAVYDDVMNFSIASSCPTLSEEQAIVVVKKTMLHEINYEAFKKLYSASCKFEKSTHIATSKIKAEKIANLINFSNEIPYCSLLTVDQAATVVFGDYDYEFFKTIYKDTCKYNKALINSSNEEQNSDPNVIVEPTAPAPVEANITLKPGSIVKAGKYVFRGVINHALDLILKSDPQKGWSNDLVIYVKEIENKNNVKTLSLTYNDRTPKNIIIDENKCELSSQNNYTCRSDIVTFIASNNKSKLILFPGTKDEAVFELY